MEVRQPLEEERSQVVALVVVLVGRSTVLLLQQPAGARWSIAAPCDCFAAAARWSIVAAARCPVLSLGLYSPAGPPKNCSGN